MKQDNTDRSATHGDACQSKNRQAAEAQQLREKSAFINQVASFAEYMQKEFTDDSDGDKGLIIYAADHTADERTGACHIVLGGRAVNVASLASMMQQDDMQEIFRKARILSSTDGSNSYMADELRRLHSRLNRDYAFLALPDRLQPPARSAHRVQFSFSFDNHHRQRISDGFPHYVHR